MGHTSAKILEVIEQGRKHTPDMAFLDIKMFLRFELVTARELHHNTIDTSVIACYISDLNGQHETREQYTNRQYIPCVRYQADRMQRKGLAPAAHHGGMC